MEIRTKILNNRGQILIEALFIFLMMVTILIIFKSLIDYQSHQNQYRFSKYKKENKNVFKNSTIDSK